MDSGLKVRVYSALYGAYEEPKDIPPELNGVMFTDDPVPILWNHWRMEYEPHNIVTRKGDPRLVAPMLAHKYWKTHPAVACPDADVSIWVDASIQIERGFVERAVDAMGEADWLLVRHPWRDCVYEEAEYSASLPRYQSLAAELGEQTAWYRELGYPAHGGLPATGVLVRRHTPEVVEASRHWWMECLNWTHQDQVGLPILLDMLKINYNYGLEWMDGWTTFPHSK